MRSELRKAVNEFHPQVKDKIGVDYSFREVSELFLRLNPTYKEYSVLTVSKYFKEVHNGKKKYKKADDSQFTPIETQMPQNAPDLSGVFDFTPIDIPASWSPEKGKYRLQGFKKLGIISDIHLPYHDCGAIAAALSELKKREIDGLLMNGDVMDFKSICHHTSRERVKYATLMEEIKVGRAFLTELRKFFPNIPIFYKEGNHETWLTLAVNKVPQIASLEGVDIPNLLRLKDYDINFIPEWQVMEYGKLSIIHGHEVRLSGVNPARNLWLKTYENCLAGHVHRQSSQSVNSIAKGVYGCWTTGCLADLQPGYAGANPQAEHGCATVSLIDKDLFHVDLIRIYNGKVL